MEEAQAKATAEAVTAVIKSSEEEAARKLSDAQREHEEEKLREASRAKEAERQAEEMRKRRKQNKEIRPQQNNLTVTLHPENKSLRLVPVLPE